jgi:tRNA threonylcarbamoyladenosine biosynthesis protein TsaB
VSLVTRAWLAIEASTPVGGVAVGDADTLLAEIVLGNQARHSDLLVPAIDFALRCAGLDRRELAGLIVGSGPGSFTGVRVAAAAAKGMARALAVPLYAAPSLAALALAVEGADAPVCALFDARRGEVYVACYRFDGKVLQTLVGPRVCAVEHALTLAKGHGASCAGEAAWLHAEKVHAAGLRLAGSRHTAPRAAALLRLQGVGGGAQPVEPGPWEPLYLRASGAERGRR